MAVSLVASTIGHTGLLSRRLPEAQQAPVLALVSACGQGGRCVAPLAAAAVYAAQRHNGLFLYLLLSVGLAHALPLLRMRHVYGDACAAPGASAGGGAESDRKEML